MHLSVDLLLSHVYVCCIKKREGSLAVRRSSPTQTVPDPLDRPAVSFQALFDQAGKVDGKAADPLTK